MPTPIRVRGRRKTPSRSKDGVPKPVPSGPKGGRPMLPPDAKRRIESYKRTRPLPAQPPPPRPRKRVLSRLESLPVELIEKIFLYSLSVSLPRSSPSIRAAVSSERVYRALMLLAFFDPERIALPELYQPSSGTVSSADPKTVALKVSEAQISRILRPLEYVHLGKGERRSLQASVVSCRWCTIERLMSSLPDLMLLNIWRYWVPETHGMSNDQQDQLDLFLARRSNALDLEIVDGDYRRSISVTPLVSVTIRHAGPDIDSTVTINTLDVFKIPDKFLSGGDAGFSEAHARFLELFRVAGGINRLSSTERINEINFSREAIQQGIHMALVEHNANVLTTLLKIDEFTFRCQNHLADTLYMLPSEYFCTAVVMARHDPKFFQLLLRASAESIPFDDSKITQWAITEGGPFQQWLLDFMLQLPEQVKATTRGNQQMFYNGGLNAANAMAERYLRNVLGTDEPKVWLEESPYTFSDDWVVEN
ncbi:uncharacterized protein DSM5745_04164 [Aspergillus mulundensis]|uniref:F-box domain-containing protein n=1 Tax=Aspergillus mulundensis TaxID=1810919 RepID=A0A3D8SDK2_9EURO|nr:Uncharacterized protein DSM5745_04164 [Aspergillus mulundensis]RDW83838.1 Uncharacterized protein DSM5745_04164 [Aspergillus mulundensis]